MALFFGGPNYPIKRLGTYDMNNLIDITGRLPPPVPEEITIASKLSTELIEVLNKYRNTIRNDLFAGVVADCLVKVINSSQQKDLLVAQCILYINDQVEKKK